MNDFIQVSGQCLCKPAVDGRRCEECKDGYYRLEAGNAFGCVGMLNTFSKEFFATSDCLSLLCFSSCSTELNLALLLS